jgi:hypothetical protein
MLRAERAARLAAEAKAQARTLLIEKFELNYGMSSSDSPQSAEPCWTSSSCSSRS